MSSTFNRCLVGLAGAAVLAPAALAQTETRSNNDGTTSTVIIPGNQPRQVGGMPEGLQPATDGTPRLVFERMRHNFGDIWENQIVETEFRFMNMGDGTLTMLKPTATCGCTVGELPKLVWGPGEGGVLSVKYDPHNRRGKQQQTVTIMSNDPSAPVTGIQLGIDARVLTIIAIEPQTINFGEVQIGVPSTVRFRVVGRGENFEALYASSTRGRLFDIKPVSTELITADGPPMRATVFEMTFNGNAPRRGRIAGLTTVRTTDEEYPLVNAEIIADVVGDLRLLPKLLTLGIRQPGQDFTSIFRIRSRSGKEFEILGFENGPSNLPKPLEVTWRPKPDGDKSEYIVEVRGVTPTEAGAITGEIRLRTNADEEILKVSLNGAVRPPPPNPEGGGTPVGPPGGGG